MFPKILKAISQFLLIFMICVGSVAVIGPLFTPGVTPEPEPVADIQIMDIFDNAVSPSIEQAREAALSVPVVYMIPKDAAVAPKPDQSKFGSTTGCFGLVWQIITYKEV